LINLFDHFFPSLLQKPGFLKEFVTPIIKVKSKRSGAKPLEFFTIPEFEEWQKNEPNPDKFSIKYYKGLGTSTAAEAKEYFSDLPKHVIQFQYTGQSCSDSIKLGFLKTMADERKTWLSGYDKYSFLDHNIKKVSFNDFIQKELIHFSIADNQRSIPSVLDGLKPG